MQATNKFLVRPNDCNLWGALFGGKLMAEIDVCGYYVARKALHDVDYSHVTTAGFDKITFSTPAFPGDIVRLVGQVEHYGKTSLKIFIEGHKESVNGDAKQICFAIGTWVCIKDNKPHPHGKKLKTQGEFRSYRFKKDDGKRIE